jgi:HlyD family secretion protein
MKKHRKSAIVIIGIVLITAIAFWFFNRDSSVQSSVVITEKPQRGSILKTVITTGTVEPVNTVSVGCQVSGTILKLHVDYNSVVKAGDLLAELDRTLFVAALNQANSNYEQVRSKQIYQKSNFERQSQLFNVGAISKAEYENALCSFNSAEAEAKVAIAQVQTAKKNLALASIYSPIDGTILSRSVSEGQTVAASFSTPTLFSIAKDLTKMQVEASVDEADIGNIREGDRVVFSVDAFPNDTFDGIVQQVRLNPTTTNNVVTYSTIINTSNKDLKLKPGMTANITICTNEVSNALLIPVKAIEFRPDSTCLDYEIVGTGKDMPQNASSVWVLQDRKLSQKIIRTGINNKTQVEVLEGLSDNDAVGIELRAGKIPDETDNGSTSSPFMPKRPGSNKSKNN